MCLWQRVIGGYFRCFSHFCRISTLNAFFTDLHFPQHTSYLMLSGNNGGGLQRRVIGEGTSVDISQPAAETLGCPMGSPINIHLCHRPPLIIFEKVFNNCFLWGFQQMLSNVFLWGFQQMLSNVFRWGFPQMLSKVFVTYEVFWIPCHILKKNENQQMCCWKQSN